MRIHKIHALWLVLLLLAGCQTLGIPEAATFNQRVSAAYVTLTGITDATLALGQAGKISLDDAQNVANQAVNLKAGLDIAKSLHAANPGAAEDKLTVTLAALQALDAYLKTKGAQ